MNKPLPKITDRESVIIESTWNFKTEKSPFILNFLSLQNSEIPDRISLYPMEQIISIPTKSVKVKAPADSWNFLSEEHGYQLMHKVSIATLEIFTKLESSVIEKYLVLGEKNQDKTLTKWQRFLNHYFGITFPKFIDKKRSLDKIIQVATHKIHSTSRKGHGTGVIVSPELATHLWDSPYFLYNPENRVVTSPFYRIGNLANSVQVIVDSTGMIPNNKMVVFRKTFATEPGVATIEFGNPNYNTIHGTDYALDTTVTARVDAVQIGKDSEAMTNYWTETISFSKKPLWRKLLSI